LNRQVYIDDLEKIFGIIKDHLSKVPTGDNILYSTFGNTAQFHDIHIVSSHDMLHEYAKKKQVKLYSEYKCWFKAILLRMEEDANLL
jgi:hypothetical protein